MSAYFNQSGPKIAVVIPTHNRWAEARSTLACLSQSEYRSFEVILVEDGCTDGTVDHCRKEFPGVHILHGDGNLWWSGAVNKGVEYALSCQADAIVWLNDDNRVEPETLTSLVESYLQVGDRSIVCARTKSTATGTDEWVGEPPRWHPQFGKWEPPDLVAPEVAIEHPPGGRGVLIPAQCFREIGLVDQRAFPHYWSDHDFHYRAMKAGYRYYLATKAAIWNVPNAKRKEAPDEFTIKWAFQFLFSRRSAMNILTLRRLLKRHLTPEEYRTIYFPLLWRTLTWIASGWAASIPVLHRLLRSIKKGLI